MKKIISFIVLILWMIVIFSFSSADAYKSTGTSDKVITTMIEIKDKITNNETPNNEKEITQKKTSLKMLLSTMRMPSRTTSDCWILPAM